MLSRSIRTSISCRRFLASSSYRLYATTSSMIENSESEDSDCLDISSYGRYSFVLPDDPTREGVAHIIPQTVPERISRPLYARRTHDTGQNVSERRAALAMHSESNRPRLKRNMPSDSIKKKLQRMKPAGRIAGLALLAAENIIKPGVTTREINTVVHELILSHEAYPSPLLYEGFPMSCCTSCNNILIHGIPDNRPLEDGDLVNVDITAFKNSWHGDTSRTFLVGDVDQQGKDLVQATNDALRAAIAVCGPGVPYSLIGRTIAALSRDRGFSVSSQVLGHGIGTRFHRSPWIHHTENYFDGLVMQSGDSFTIEPALVQGEDPTGWVLLDGWTVLSETGARGAQAEHTIMITEDGAQVLTTVQT